MRLNDCVKGFSLEEEGEMSLLNKRFCSVF